MDTEIAYMQVWSQFSREIGCPCAPDAFKQFIGISSNKTAQWLYERSNRLVSIEEILITIETRLVDFIQHERTPPLPGVKEMFDIGDKLGFKRGLVTTSDRRIALPIIKSVLAGIGRLTDHNANFNVIVTGDMANQKKPDPEVYLIAAKGLGVAPESCMAFEDSPVGTAAAKAAGCITIAIPSAHMAQEDVSRFSDFTFSTLLEAYKAEVWNL
jgi:beta-phosphoglucomutase-like phosphatase (HAD superfamily)